MDEVELTLLLESLLKLPGENEVVEFKRAKNGFGEQDLGEYFSALCNEANLKEHNRAWLILGIDNNSHNVIGTNYKNSRPALDAMKQRIAEQTTANVTFNEIYDLKYNGKRVVMFEIPPAPKGIPIAYKGHYYGRNGESLVGLNINEIERIRAQASNSDWSAQIVNDATIDDLDPEAIAKARSLYISGHKEKAHEIEEWDDVTFLNKAKITIKGKITNAAIVLLGKEESEYLISPSVAKIKWILKDPNGIERDYKIVSCPFLLAVDEVYGKIRNLKYRYINTEFKTLFPEEIDTYDPYVLREALNNAIAHQDYTLCGQINVVEFDDRLVFSNKGSFIPGSIENVLLNDAPEERYRNQFLAQAMVNLRMVDTIGSGIKKMCKSQRDRLFPLPYYDLSNERVTVTIIGKILDMNYSNQLARDSSLSLIDIEMLNRVQLRKKLTPKEIRSLRSRHLIEGRYPNIFISKDIAQRTGRHVEYSKHKGLDAENCRALLLESLNDHHKLSKKQIVELLWNVLPDYLNDKQKGIKIQNILSGLRRQNKIRNETVGNQSEWFLVK